MISKTRHIADTKNLTGSLPAIRYVDPEYVYLATSNARAANFEILIKEGEHVNAHQQVGVRHGPFFDQPIHSPCSGTYVGLEKHYHRLLLWVLASL